MFFRVLRGAEADTKSGPQGLNSNHHDHPSARRRRRLLDIILERKPRILATTSAHCPPAHEKKLGQVLASLVDLLALLMAWDPENRPSAKNAKGHHFFAQAHSLGWL